MALIRGRYIPAFIDFKKAYDRVDQSKLWSCLENKGLNGRLTDFSEGSVYKVKL